MSVHYTRQPPSGINLGFDIQKAQGRVVGHCRLIVVVGLYESSLDKRHGWTIRDLEQHATFRGAGGGWRGPERVKWSGREQMLGAPRLETLYKINSIEISYNIRTTRLIRGFYTNNDCNDNNQSDNIHDNNTNSLTRSLKRII